MTAQSVASVAYIGLGSNLSDFFHRLHHAGFVIRHHDGDQLRIRTKCVPYIDRIDKRLPINTQIGNLYSALLETLARV